MSDFHEFELSEVADEHASIERFCRLARVYVWALGRDDVFSVEGRVQGSQMREISWTPSDGAPVLHTLVRDYREYFEAIHFPSVDALAHDSGDDSAPRVSAHGVGLRRLTLRGDARLAQRLQDVIDQTERGEEPHVDPLQDDPRSRRMALYALGWPAARAGKDNKQLAADITTALRGALSDAAGEVRAAAAGIAGRYRVLALGTALAACAADPHAEVRASALNALRALDESEGLVHAVRSIADEDSGVRAAAFGIARHVSHLPWARRRALIGPLASHVERAWPSLDAAQRRQVLEWFVGCEHADVVRLMAAAGGDPETDVRRKAVEVTASLEHTDATSALLGFIDDPDEDVAAAAVEALSMEPARARLEADASLRAAVIEKLSRWAVSTDA